jgi:hypothetical protein
LLNSRFAGGNLKLTIRFAGNVLAVPVAYGSLFGGFAWKLFAFKAEVYSFGVGAVADLAELVLSGHATGCAVGACAALHSGAFLAGYTANTDFHRLAFSLLELVCAFGYLYLEFVRFCCCRTTIA